VDASTTVRAGSHRFYLGGARHFFSGYSEEKDNRTKQWKPKLQYNLDGYWLYSNNRLKLKADARMFDETIQNKGPIFDTPPLYGKAFDTYFYTRRLSYKGLLSYKRYAESNLDVIFSYNRFNRTKNTFTKDLTTLTEIINPDPSLHDTTLFQSVIARATYSGKLSGWSTTYQAGIDANLETGDGERIKDGYQEIGDYAGFLSLKQPLGQSIALQAGARYGYNTRYKSPLVPTLNIRFSPMDKLVTRISYARGFRAPSLKELYLFFVDINHNISGNENLKAEYSNNITGSVNYTIENDKNIYDLETDFFVNRISNNINLAIDTLGVYSYVNIARLNTWGGNLNLKYRLHPRFYAHLGVTLVGKKSSLSSTFADGTKYYYYNDVVAEVNYKLLSRNSQFSIFFKSYGKQPQFYVDEQDNLVEGFIDPYQMLDFTYIKSIMNERMQLSVGAKNILNVRNIAASALTSGAHSSGSGIYPAGYGRTFFIS
jgi:outer membrane receptor for ferrienterochelin and colicins